MKHLNGKIWPWLAVITTLVGTGLIFGLRMAKAQIAKSTPSPTSAIIDSPNTLSGVVLVNPGFEGDWAHTPCDIYNAYGHYVYSAPIAEIFVPDGWKVFFRHGPPVAHDPENTIGWAQPEMHVINKEPPFLDPPRIQAGQRALKLFTLWKIHDAGLYQQVQVPPGIRLRLSGWVHAWTSEQDDPYQSTGDPLQAWHMVGLDPTGGKNPFGPAVVWSEPAHIYDVYAQTPSVEVTSQGSTLTVFVRSWMLWPYKHNDVYWDAITLEPVYTGPLPVLTVEPTLRTAYQGQNVTYTVALSTTSGFTLPFTLSLGAIPGAASAFDPTAVQPGETATLVFTPSLSTHAGTYSTTITGAATMTTGSVQIPITLTTPVSLTVLPADFTLDATPVEVTVVQGQTASFLIELASPTPGFAFPVALDVTGVPSNTFSSITPSAVTSGTQARMFITTTHKTPVSSHELIITGTADGLERTTAATLKARTGAFLPIVVKHWLAIP